MEGDSTYVPAAAVQDARAVIYGEEYHDGAFCQYMERKWPAKVWREAIRQAIAAPEPPRHAVSKQLCLFGTPP